MALVMQQQQQQQQLPAVPQGKEPPKEEPEEPPPPLTRNQFEDEFPVMFKFYRERGLLPEFLMQKVQEIQRRWKSGFVFWLTHDNQEIEIPQWVAVNVVINNKQNVQRGARICMSLNHTKGYGCNRRNEGACSYVHECALCGQEDHGVFQKRQNGSWMCNKLRKWNEEEKRFQKTGFGDPWSREEVLTELARQQRSAARAPTVRVAPGASAAPGGALAARTDPQGPRAGQGIAWDGPGHAPGVLAAAAAAAATTAPAATRALVGGDGKSSNGFAVESLPVACSWTAGDGGGSSAEDGCAAAGPLSAARVGNIASEQGSQVPRHPPMRPPPAHPPPPRLPANWQALWCEAEGLYYFWHRPTNHTSWEVPEIGLDAPPAVQPQLAGEAQTEVSEVEVEFVCIRHWRPHPGVESLDSCMRVLQGDRFLVTWLSGDARGWVYGHALDDPNRVGYFPREVLVQARESARSRTVGELCTVSAAFTEPEEVSGYLPVEPGDVLRVVAPMERPFIWAFVERAGGSQPAAGWVPESVLKDPGVLGSGPEVGGRGGAREVHESLRGLQSRVG